MKHHRRKPDASAHAEGARRFRERLAVVTEAAQLPDTAANKLRLEDATYLDLQMDALRRAILLGQTVEIAALERLAAARAALVPVSSPPITVRFIHTCFECRASSDVDPDTLCAQCRAALPPKAACAPAGPVQASEPAPVAVEPVAATSATPNVVVPITKPARTKADDYRIAAHVDIAAGERRPVPLLKGNSLAERVAFANASPSSSFAPPGGANRFDNNG
ncbi:MAG: hypothetical protein WCB22_31585 [Pseudolabrys sp.]|jgi:hypothetical protein